MKSGLKKIAAFVFGLASLGATGQNQVKTEQGVTIQQRDAIQQQFKTPAPESVAQRFSGSSNPYKTFRRGIYNQRQYRKMLRQNPSFRRSKKCKL